MAIYLKKYKPIISTAWGISACRQHNIPFFVDGSIRREPDLELQYPSVTSLCYPTLVGKLQVGDKVVCLTTKGTYCGLLPHWRLTAILEVVKIVNDHATAASWYQNKNSRLPYNCVVPHNLPLPLCQSAGLAWSKSYASGAHNCQNQMRGCNNNLNLCVNRTRHRAWSQDYYKRQVREPRFAICKPDIIDLNNPPVLYAVPESIHHSRNWCRLDTEEYKFLVKGR